MILYECLLNRDSNTLKSYNRVREHNQCRNGISQAQISECCYVMHHILSKMMVKLSQYTIRNTYLWQPFMVHFFVIFGNKINDNNIIKSSFLAKIELFFRYFCNKLQYRTVFNIDWSHKFFTIFWEFWKKFQSKTFTAEKEAEQKVVIFCFQTLYFVSG